MTASARAVGGRNGDASAAAAAALALRLLAARRLGPLLRSRIRACPEVVQELKRHADALLGSDVRAALRAARLARAAGLAARDPLARAFGLHSLAKACHAGRRYRAAARAHAEAATAYRAIGRRRDAAKVELARIDALMHLGEHRAAEEAAHRAIAALGRERDKVGVAKALVNFANLRHAQDRHRDAIRLLERARPVLARAGERQVVAIVDYNRANSYSLLARFDRSEPLYARARHELEELGQDEHVAVVDYNLAYDHYLQGRFHQARRLLAEVRRAFRRAGAEHSLALASLDEGEICLTLGLARDAAETAAEARHIFLRHGATLDAARAALVGATAARLGGEIEAARELLLAARRAFATARHPPGLASVDLALAALPSAELPARRQARALRAARVFHQRGLLGKEAAALVVAGLLALERGRLDAAHERLTRAASLARRRGLVEAELRACHALGRTAQAAGREAAAGRHYQRAVQVYERLRSGIRLDRDRLSFASDTSAVFEDAVRNALDLGRLDQAFDLVERARSRALADLLAADPTLRDAMLRAGGRLARRLQRIKAEISGLEARTRHSERRLNTVPSALRKRLGQALAENDLAMTRLAAAAPRTSYALIGRPVASLAEVRRALGADRALIAYFTEGEQLGAILVTAAELRVWRSLTTCSAVAADLDSFRFAVGLARQARGRHPLLARSANAVLESLRRRLLEPLELALGPRALVVMPPAFLHLVPFHALARDGRPLLAEREVSMVPSATVLVWSMRQRPRTSGALVLSVPDAEAPAIDGEAQAVARILGERVLSGQEASAGAFRRLAPGRRVIHLAAHGVFEPDEPLLSGFELGDGRLTVAEIAGLGLDAALVTLAACETAVGLPRGDELLGLVRAFLHAGARSVVASLWPVHDASTTRLMEAFYTRLGRGETTAGALRGAVLALREEEPHPYHWAAFQLVGSWLGIQG